MRLLRQYYLQIAGVILALGLGFSLLGVYDTHTLPFYMRFTFWSATMATGIIATFLVMPLIVNRWMAGQTPPLQVFASAVIASFPVTVVLTIFNPTFGFDSSLILWGIQFGYVLMVSIAVGIINYPFMKRLGVFGENAEIAGADPVKIFLKRLPRKFHSADLYGLSAEDHYLRVYTDKGETLILLRLTDAVRELSDADGLQVHRSWWVLRSGIADAQRRDGKLWLQMKSGTEVPVSRTYLAAARDAFER